MFIRRKSWALRDAVRARGPRWDFLEARRDLIARKLNEFMQSLITQPEELRHRPIRELISLGESSVLEFKSTFQWDVMQNKQNSAIEKLSLVGELTPGSGFAARFRCSIFETTSHGWIQLQGIRRS